MKEYLKPIELSHQRPTITHDFYYELHPDHLEAKFAFDAMEPLDKEDFKSGEVLVKNYFHIFAKKHSISGVELGIITGNKWKVSAICKGFSNDIAFYFNDLSEAKKHLKNIKDWWLNANMEQQPK
jgi:hypothetical protein